MKYDNTISGFRAQRPRLNQAIGMLRESCTLIVWKLDRLGRGVKHQADLIGQLPLQCIQFRSLTDAITASAPGRLYLHVMASLVETQNELTVERTRAGLQVTRQPGRRGGRKRQMTDSNIESDRKPLANGTPTRDVARSLGVCVPTLCRCLPASSST